MKKATFGHMHDALLKLGFSYRRIKNARVYHEGKTDTLVLLAAVDKRRKLPEHTLAATRRILDCNGVASPETLLWLLREVK